MAKLCNVHYIETDLDGVKWYGIGLWNLKKNLYTAPSLRQNRCDPENYSVYNRYPIGYYTLEEARRRAVELWGYAKVRQQRYSLRVKGQIKH